VSPATAAPGAAPWVPASRSLRALAAAARGCRGCPLYRHATQTVFGAGPARAAILLVGEQPGDREDLAGAPFVGPAGRVLDEALARAGLSRSDVFLTNAVKHFKFEPRGKKRIHQKPNAAELEACRPWLHAELEAVRPRVIVSLGATAARSLAAVSSDGAASGMRIATIHPSAALRAPEREVRHALRARLARDLRKARRASQASQPDLRPVPRAARATRRAPPA
jgi:uracil-DNA glycosylase family protein